MVQRWFIHYFEPGDRVFPNGFGDEIANKARSLHVNGKPFFDHVITYHKSDLPTTFVEQHARHFQHTRGAGYWCWKPYIIKMTLARMAKNDELLYCDTGIQLTEKIIPAFNLLKVQDVVPFRLRQFTDNKWTKMDLAVKLGAVSLMSTQQRSASHALFRKTKASVKLVDEWVKLAADYDLLTDVPSVAKNHPTFMFHKHDQSMWSLLTKVHGYKAYPPVGLRKIRLLSEEGRLAQIVIDREKAAGLERIRKLKVIEARKARVLADNARKARVLANTLRRAAKIRAARARALKRA